MGGSPNVTLVVFSRTGPNVQGPSLLFPSLCAIPLSRRSRSKTYRLPLPWCHSQPRNPRQFPAALPDHSLARWSKKIPFLGVEKQGMGPEAAS